MDGAVFHIKNVFLLRRGVRGVPSQRLNMASAGTTLKILMPKAYSIAT